MNSAKLNTAFTTPMPLSRWISRRRQQLSARLFVLHERSRMVTQKLHLEGLDEEEATLAGTSELLKRLLSAEKHMRQMLVDHPAAVFVVSTDGRVELSNGAARDLLLMLGQSPRPGREPQAINDLLPGVLDQDQLEYPIHIKDQPAGLVALVVKRMSVVWGNADATLILLYDVTPQAQAREELERAVSQLEGVNQLKSEFISMASHEFRTPLTSVLSSLELMGEYVRRAGDDLSEDFVNSMNRHLVRSREAVNHLDNMVAEMLVLEKTNAGQFTCQPAHCDVGPLVREVIASLAPSCEQSGVRLTLSAADTVSAFVDERLLRHIITNLVTNAIRFTLPEGHVTVSLVTDPEGLTLDVEDDGLGIPEVDQAHIFETFYRGRNGQHAAGTGLGLAIVKRFLDLHQGTIAVTSTEGKGTWFRLFFPAQVGVDAHE